MRPRTELYDMQTIHSNRDKQICIKIANRGPNNLMARLRYEGQLFFSAVHGQNVGNYPNSSSNEYAPQKTMEWVVYPANDAINATVSMSIFSDRAHHQIFEGKR